MLKLPLHDDQILCSKLIECLEHYRDDPRVIPALEPNEGLYNDDRSLSDKDLARSRARTVWSLHTGIDDIRDQQLRLLRQQAGLAFLLWNGIKADEDSPLRTWAENTLKTAREIEEEKRPGTIDNASANNVEVEMAF